MFYDFDFDGNCVATKLARLEIFVGKKCVCTKVYFRFELFFWGEGIFSPKFFSGISFRATLGSAVLDKHCLAIFHMRCDC